MPVASRAIVNGQRVALQAIQERQRNKICAAFAHAHMEVMPAIQAFCAAYEKELTRVRTAQPDSAGSDPDSEPDPHAHVSVLWLHSTGQLTILRQAMEEAVRTAAGSSLAAIEKAKGQAAKAGATSGVNLIKAANR